nr:diuretic hormone receptor-like [Leptinotarsa decemlineata]
MNGSYSEEENFRTNVSLEQCKVQYENETIQYSQLYPEGFCPVISDSVLCWPPTPLNETATIKCFSELFNIKYDDTQNATRECSWNGTWSKSNYSSCKEIIALSADVETQTTIYFVGYTLSLITLVIAMAIFTYFKELRCLRNTIHMNLMWSYVLTYCMWILTLISLNFGSNVSITCVLIVTLLHYFHITTFFWMFVEGLYLYILVVETLTRENFKLRVYVCIGWGLPMVFIVVWAIVKSFLPVSGDPANTECLASIVIPI